MAKLLPPQDPADSQSMASLISPLYVACFPPCLFPSTSYSCCPPIHKVTLNVIFYLGKYRMLGKELRNKNLQLRYERVPDYLSLKSLDNPPNPSGTLSCLGSASSVRPQFLPNPGRAWAPNLSTALLHHHAHHHPINSYSLFRFQETHYFLKDVVLCHPF